MLGIRGNLEVHGCVFAVAARHRLQVDHVDAVVCRRDEFPDGAIADVIPHNDFVTRVIRNDILFARAPRLHDFEFVPLRGAHQFERDIFEQRRVAERFLAIFDVMRVPPLIGFPIAPARIGSNEIVTDVIEWARTKRRVALMTVACVRWIVL